MEINYNPVMVQQPISVTGPASIQDPQQNQATTQFTPVYYPQQNIVNDSSFQTTSFQNNAVPQQFFSNVQPISVGQPLLTHSNSGCFSPVNTIPNGYTLVGVNNFSPPQQTQYVSVLPVSTASPGVQYSPFLYSQPSIQTPTLIRTTSSTSPPQQLPQQPLTLEYNNSNVSNSQGSNVSVNVNVTSGNTTGTDVCRRYSKCSNSTLDGSEYSESELNQSISKLSLTRSGSRDGYGSDTMSTTCSDDGTQQKVPEDVEGEEKCDVESPDKMLEMNIKAQSPALMIPFDSLISENTSSNALQAQVYQGILQQQSKAAFNGQGFYLMNVQTGMAMPPTANNGPHFKNVQNVQQGINTNYKNNSTSNNSRFRIPDRSKKLRPTSKERQEELFKTELCNAWINGQKCRFGKKCIFAHGAHEIRQPRRKIERMQRKTPLKHFLFNGLNRLNMDNFDDLSTDLISRCVEEVRDRQTALSVIKIIFDQACNGETKYLYLYSKFWHKLINIHDFSNIFKSEMQNLVLNEYRQPKNKNSGLGDMSWVAELVKRNLFGVEIVHKILGDMSTSTKTDSSLDIKLMLWCKLIESLAGSVDTSRYFNYLANFKNVVGQQSRFLIMNLEDLRNRNWIPRQ